MGLPWAAMIGVAMSIIELFISDKKRRDALKLQMYEFAKQHDRDSIEGNEKIRQEYARIREELDKGE